MLAWHKLIPNPVDFWTSSYHVQIHADACTACGKCEERCPVNATIIDEKKGFETVNLKRCIGCGLCTTTCPNNALELKKKEHASVPPVNDEAMWNTILENKKQDLSKLKTALKIMLSAKK
jgi:ferredoxin